MEKILREVEKRTKDTGNTGDAENIEDVGTEILEEILIEVELMTKETECTECAEEKRKKIERDCNECGRGVSWEENKYALVGMDAVALFPSLSGKTTARIVRKRVMESEVKCEGFN